MNAPIDITKIPLRFSRLKLMGQSPAHYRWAALHDFVATPAMKVGTIAHALILGESTPFVVYDGKRQGNAWKDFQAEHAGKDIFTIAEYDKAIPIAESLANSDDARPWLDGVAEQQIEWTYCGREATSRPDIRGATFVTDVKTTVSSKPAKFAMDAYWRGYHAQLAFYQEACGLPPTAPCYIVAVESKPPYCVTVFQAEQGAIDVGHMMCRAWFEQLRICEDANHWPGYASGIQPFGIPERDDVDLVFGDEEGEAA